ncbi:hypothetical protein BJV74DRAFT_775412 [Russula compacta]|nr:hypothetical protein BJV74DRAFT_775412 [Russula compacta]
METSSDPQTSQETASLVLRLAGPSTTKAGLSTEQTEINRIIAEASKGSKFYENEKRKDKEVTARIERILKLRDQAMKGVDMAKVEQKADHLLEVIERERDLTQFIVHFDMDAFYANVELLDNPGLAGKAFGVGHGVLTTASYEARKYGVRSGMPGYIARKLCPDLIFVDLHMSRYSEVSKRIMAIFRQYDPNLLAASVDEAFHPSITEYCTQHNLDPDECVRRMRQRVFDETKLTVSAGIAANKMLAKNKPNGQFHLSHTSEAIKEFMHCLPIRKIPGVGRVNERMLDSIGVKTCGDIYQCRSVLSLLDKQFGLRSMLRVHLGIASNVVQPWAREERKSIGSERTFGATSEKEKILQKLEDIAAELEDDMEGGGWTGRTVTLKYKLDTYEVFTRAKSFNRWVKTKAELYEAGKELLQPEWPLCLRLIGLRVTKLNDLRKKEDGIVSDAVSRKRGPLSHQPQPQPMRDEHTTTPSKIRPDAVTASPSPRTPPEGEEESTSAAAAVGECPLCTRPFTDNDELNAHIDWCLSREAIRSAQVEGDRDRIEQKKSEDDVQHPNPTKEWWKGGSAEDTSTGRSRKPKRRKLGR